jgi:hypothetical protein
MTFYGLGYHEQLDRWLTDEWFWYQANIFPDMMDQTVDNKEAKEMLMQRLDEISPDAGKYNQSKGSRIFDVLADLTNSPSIPTSNIKIDRQTYFI